MLQPLLSLEVSIGLMLLMYGISGISKVSTWGDTEVERFQEKMENWKLPLNELASKAIIFAAGVLELSALALIAAGCQQQNVRWVAYGTNMLIAFTILATLIFYVGPNWKAMAFFSNMTATAALLMIVPAAVDKYVDGDRPPPLLI